MGSGSPGNPVRPLRTVATPGSDSALQTRDIHKARVITPVFHEVKEGGTGKVISFSAKFARGLMARYIVERRIDEAEALKQFDLERYSFQPGAGPDGTWIFSRDFIPAR